MDFFCYVYEQDIKALNILERVMGKFPKVNEAKASLAGETMIAAGLDWVPSDY